ncbi:MAG: hypothetical protein BAJALOKI2v1_200012 [Promethearchaeota archaeon]|nr:MAG: hypothetical protein BAJALOKI2v1_200012 [Candidatus Lokiarchaeota archaeon]
MRQKKTIRIKNPKLIKIRNNLRTLWIEFSKDLRRKLDEKEERILDSSEEGDLMEISHKKQEISLILEKSICKCYNCFRTNTDMTYNPLEKAWFCVDCYKDINYYLKQGGDSLLFP